MLPTWIGNFSQESVEFIPVSGILIDQSCQKLLLVVTNLGIQTYTSSNLSFFFLHQGVNLDGFIPGAGFSFLIILR